VLIAAIHHKSKGQFHISLLPSKSFLLYHKNNSNDKAEKIWKEVKKKRRDLMLAVSEETDDQNLKVKGLHSIQKTGIIYLVEHELYDGWLKCGMTVNMKSRLKSYNLCDPLKRYMVVASKVVKR
jgi:predicted GIY-YIG superfamily endonuclease